MWEINHRTSQTTLGNHMAALSVYRAFSGDAECAAESIVLMPERRNS